MACYMNFNPYYLHLIPNFSPKVEGRKAGKWFSGLSPLVVEFRVM
jgi:hypothetical protein